MGGDLTISALWKSTYYKYGNASATVLQTNCVIVYHSKNIITGRNVDRKSIVCLEFFWKNFLSVAFSIRMRSLLWFGKNGSSNFMPEKVEVLQQNIYFAMPTSK